ncbi:MAG TPA: RdgB/HAM1 family non-canonical purine NTP pyrophosphatase [Chloroflexota bacterium]|nr:RdgB/HAM1 family non-canonical purine NTP pyrophosphatase [Chloroflexota bacterium]
MKLLIATNNQDKVREFREILEGLPVEVVTPAELGLQLEVEETGTTFAQNAALKARAFHKASGLAALADDSGLEVDALDGEPGVYSSRYAGLPNGEVKNRFMLQKLEGVPWEKRGARYVCEIAIVDEKGRIHRCRGTLRGKIALEPKGRGGFGYDPIVYIPSKRKTVAEMSPEEKNAISHRGLAGRRARVILERMITSS